MKIIITIETEGELSNSKAHKNGGELEVTASQYARFFDEGCAHWQDNVEWNLMYLRMQEDIANQLLRQRGYLFLNEVYDLLGIPRTKAGQIVGWIYDEKNPTGDNCVDFGIFDERNASVVNGRNKVAILLDFNVDGNIMDKF